MSDKPITVFRTLAPTGWTTKRVIISLQVDPYQSRVSSNYIPLTHPRTGRTLPLKEFANDIVGDSRFAIEASDGLVFVSRLFNSGIGEIFKPMKVISKEEWKRITS